MRWIFAVLMGLILLGSAYALPGWLIKKLQVVSYDLNKPSVTVKTPGGRLITLYGEEAEHVLEHKKIIIKHKKKESKLPASQMSNNMTELNTTGSNNGELNSLSKSQTMMTNTDCEIRLAKLEERVTTLENTVNRIMEFFNRLYNLFTWFMGVG